MPTFEEYTTALSRASLTFADAVTSLITKEKLGCLQNWSKQLCQLEKLKSAEFFYFRQDYTSQQSLYFYNELLGIAGGLYGDGISLDPNAQIPNITVIVNGDDMVLNSSRYFFTNLTAYGLSNYQSNYYPTFGTYPDFALFVANGDGTYSQDTGNVPQVQFVGDIPANGIQSIQWAFPIQTSGYIQITGARP